MKHQWRILVVDDEEVMCDSLAAWLREDGYTVDTASCGREGVDRARENSYAICFVDLKMPGGMDGIETILQIRKLRPDASLIIITAFATVDTAITAMKEGAQEYIVKPCNPAEISLLVERIIKVKNLQRENSILRRKLTRQYRFHDIISKNAKMQGALDLARRVANLRSTVLIQGESGTGKELVARAIHNSGDRASKPFIAINCAALTESLLETELFGHEKGAFTGANGQKKGKFEQADGGTIFLDEIGDISPKVQVELLRVLQERSFYRVGGSEEIQVDARVIAASHVNLQQAVRDGKFRDDLYYRLNVVEVQIPPLRSRRDDIPLLANYFIDKLAHELGRNINGISESAMKTLMDYDWPGNVRELENALERAIVTSASNMIGQQDLAFIANADNGRKGWHAPTDMALAEVEKQVIAATLERHQGNITETAEVLGIDRSTLYEKIKRYEIPRAASV